MSISFRCPCGQKLKVVRDGAEAMRARCPNCGNWLHVPTSSLTDAVAEVISPPSEHTASEAPAEIASQADAPKAEGAMKVLIAESDEADRKAIISALRGHSYEVLEALNGQQALDMIRRERPNALIINVKLEGMGGFQVVQQLRNPANEVNKDIWDMPILMTTEKLHGRDKQYSLSLGADGYFVKPVPPAQICARLEKVAAKRTR